MDAGLADIIAAETVLSEVDGQNGRLIVRGHDIEALAGHRTFEAVIHLLWDGFFDDLPSVAELARKLGETRVDVFARLTPHWSALRGRPAVEAQRIALSLIDDGDDLDVALRLIAAAGVATGAVTQILNGQTPIEPDPAAGHGADILHMITGVPVAPELAAALETYLVTVADHGLNASTFAARTVASTRAGLGSAVIGGLSALKGPLHGGAPGPVLDMLDAIGDPGNAESWLGAALERGERLMGFGHRIYKVRDPRADVLKAAAANLPRGLGRLALAEQIETEALVKLAAKKPNQSLETNVEYYTATLLEALSIPREVFTCLFATGRAVGWVAHAREQLATNRIIRPRSTYVGPKPLQAA